LDRQHNAGPARLWPRVHASPPYWPGYVFRPNAVSVPLKKTRCLSRARTERKPGEEDEKPAQGARDGDHGAGMGADGAASAPHPLPSPPAVLPAGLRSRRSRKGTCYSVRTSIGDDEPEEV